ncbi:hypothetical protein [Catenulispora rubra]|uniref:hypothetical protein n=1 Tax=Catenulispora rubra TaxID=280293 RepID=UPI00189248C0|nr:hypothetical protein [Catenulispora rubra]
MSVQAQIPTGGVEREQFAARLAQIKSDLADLYRCATNLVDAPRRDRAVVVMISHAVREIANNLAHYLGLAEGIDLPASVGVNEPAQDLAAAWRLEMATPREAHGFTEGPDGTIRGADLLVSPRVVATIEAVVRAAVTVEASTARRRAYVAVGNESAVNNPTAKLLGETWEYFVARAHLDRATKAGRVVEEELRTHFARFETIVSARIGSFFAVNQELSDILEITNTRRLLAPPDPEPTLDTE